MPLRSHFIVAYARERLPLKIWGGLALVIAAAAWFSSQDLKSFAVGTFLYDFGVAFLLIAGWRLWDDLVDLEHDRHRHPERILVRSGEAHALYGPLLGFLAAGVLFLYLGSNSSAASILAILVDLGLWLWYGVLSKRRRLQSFTHFAILVKYPAAVAILGLRHTPVDAGRLVLAQAVVLGIVLVYEIFHPSL